MNKIIHGLVAFTIIDLLYTTIGAFYGGGGAELNPLFSWIHDPAQFIIFIVIVKVIVVGALVWGIWWLNEHEKRHHFQYARALGIGANVVYAGLLFGILWVNIGYQFL